VIIKTDYSTTRVTVTPQEALELIRQLADAVASATARQRAHSFCTGATGFVAGTSHHLSFVASTSLGGGESQHSQRILPRCAQCRGQGAEQ
jgi:hypothetical protein